jgi:nicotinamidase/pyrazinamidase
VSDVKFNINSEDALIVVDVQRDFCPGGSLPVPDGDKVIPKLNKYIDIFEEADAHIYATRDWHPPNHISFKTQGGAWPPHCVQETEGAEFHPNLRLPRGVKVFSKGTEPDSEAYSSFQGTGLKVELEKRGIGRVFVGGLATDYCVKHTVIDALEAGFETILLEDAVKGVNLKPGDSERAVEEMMYKGAEKTDLSQVTLSQRS